MSDALVSIGLPVRNGADRLEEVVWSVLAQEHDHLELVICDNASTDDTEEVSRALAKADSRIVYHRHPENVGLLNNFVSAIRLAKGGASREELMSGCGLSIHEAELVHRLHAPHTKSAGRKPVAGHPHAA